MSKAADLKKAKRKADALGLNGPVRTIIVCMDRRSEKCCRRGEMLETWKYLKKRAKQWRVQTGRPLLRIKSACIGVCAGGPIVGIMPDGVWYGRCTERVIDRIFDEHLTKNRIVEDHVIACRMKTDQ